MAVLQIKIYVTEDDKSKYKDLEIGKKKVTL